MMTPEDLPERVCAICGATEVPLVIHHVAGIANDSSLTVWLCVPHHAGVTAAQYRLGLPLKHDRSRTRAGVQAAQVSGASLVLADSTRAGCECMEPLAKDFEQLARAVPLLFDVLAQTPEDECGWAPNPVVGRSWPTGSAPVGPTTSPRPRSSKPSENCLASTRRTPGRGCSRSPAAKRVAAVRGVGETSWELRRVERLDRRVGGRRNSYVASRGSGVASSSSSISSQVIGPIWGTWRSWICAARYCCSAARRRPLVRVGHDGSLDGAHGSDVPVRLLHAARLRRVTSTDRRCPVGHGRRPL